MKAINWKYEVGDRIIRTDNKGNQVVDFVITGREVRVKKYNSKKDKRGFQNHNIRYYEYKCNICGGEHLWKPENKINTRGCACCAGKIRIKGINTIGDLFPECVPYFDRDDAFNVELGWKGTYNVKCPVCGFGKKIDMGNLLQRKKIYCEYCNSLANKRPNLVQYLVNKRDADLPFSCNRKVLTRCIDCGFEKYIDMGNLSFQGYNCPNCGDGMSYPEKYVTSLLMQLDVDFIYQLSSKHLEWCDKYKYDFYLPNSMMIIETQGIQHYEDSFCRCGGRTAKEEQENDRAKESLARRNNIGNYVVLNCRYSDAEWIRNVILNSEISKVYDLSTVNWTECAEFATESLVKKICEYWESNSGITTTDVAGKFRINQSTVRKYLKRGAELKWCSYKSVDQAERQKIPKRAVSVFRDKKYIGTFESITELVRFFEKENSIKLIVSCISRVCNGKLKSHRGYVFRFAEDER